MNILEKERKLKRLEESIQFLDEEEKITNIKKEIEVYKKEEMSKLNAWDKVLIARHVKRPKSLDYIKYLSPDFLEFHGDRFYGDDQSIIGGIGTIDGIAFTIIAQQKGSTTEENITRNFGMPNPEGYRKALRLMKQAEKFNRPILTLIDTPGAYPGVGAEERGQGQAIAQNLLEMSKLTVPIIAVIIGEGGSGGALALGFANIVLMLENSVYSILSPEGYASIVWKDAGKAALAAEQMKMTADDLLDFEVIDGIIKEPLGGAHFDREETFMTTKKAILEKYFSFAGMSRVEIQYQRNSKARSFGFLQRFNYSNLNEVYK
jgi:acetyl-CoA carboxylase carboxyl transferase subunit alpha